MKVDSTTNKFSFSTLVEPDEDLLTMSGMGLGGDGDDPGHNMGNRSEMRKSNKPIMEKRRRARINNCLNELKNILLEAMKKDPARHSKLEKADILELTVRHLQTIQRNQLAIAMATDPTVLHRFKNGFSECVTEVNRYMGRLDGADQGVRTRLLDHLGNCVNGLQHVAPAPAPFGSTHGHGPVSAFPAAVPSSFPGGMPPGIALHSAAALANLRGAVPTAPTAATHIPSQTQPHLTISGSDASPFSDDLNNNMLRGIQPPTLPHHPHETSARLMSAFAVASALPRPRPPSPPASPPPSLNMSSSSGHESSTGGSTPSSLFQMSTPSSRNDSGLSDHSDIGSTSASRSSSSSNRTSGGGMAGDPIDFSIGKVLHSEHVSSNIDKATNTNMNTPVRVKVEPVASVPTPSPDSSMPGNKDMWRPW